MHETIKVIEVINKMRTAGVIDKYAIGGAVGATFYLEPSATLDIDIFVTLKKSGTSGLLSLSPIYDYLTKLGFKTEKEYIIIEGWPVQFLPPSDALTEEALEQAVKTDVRGVPTFVMTAEHLVAIALKLGRAKDFTRILQFIETKAIDQGRLDQILKRHGLVEKWSQFRYKFLGDKK